MSYLDDAKRLERDSQKMTEQAKQLRQKAIEECPHPYAELKFEYGVTTSHQADKVEHSMIVRCKKCEGTFSNKLVEWKD